MLEPLLEPDPSLGPGMKILIAVIVLAASAAGAASWAINHFMDNWEEEERYP